MRCLRTVEIVTMMSPTGRVHRGAARAQTMHGRRLGWAFGAGTFAWELSLGTHCMVIAAHALGGAWVSVVACAAPPLLCPLVWLWRCE